MTEAAKRTVMDTAAYRWAEQATRPGMWKFLVTLIVLGLLSDHIGVVEFGVLVQHTGTAWEEFTEHLPDITGFVLAVGALISAWRGRGDAT